LIEWGHDSAVTSTVTLLEVLVKPYCDQKEELAQKVFALASTYPQIEWAPVTLSLADRAAELRVRYRLSTPDAIQVATAISRKAVCFYGNDRALRRIQEIDCVLVDDLL
jgi:predicted nucleic acid-binding protein